jgi:hypothetical protein
MRSKHNVYWLVPILSFFAICTVVAQSAPSLSGLSAEDRTSIEAACSTAKYVEGPAAYHACLQRQLGALSGSRFSDLSGLSAEDRTSIEAACSTAKYVEGPAAYHACLQRQLGALSGSRFSDLSGLSAEDRTSIEAACSTAKYVEGPAAYHVCLHQQLETLSGSALTNPSGSKSEDQPASSIVTTKSNVPASTATGTPQCAENGSCYGDPNANGVPKTVHVNGYYRKDGTYVRGHYRSAPGTNPRNK